MNWLTSLRDQLPMLLVLSPVIGVIVTLAASRFEPKLLPQFALANLFCTATILVCVGWLYESDQASEADVIRLAQRHLAPAEEGAVSLEELFRTLDRLRMDRLRNHWFVVDGINLFPVLLVVVVAIIGVWRIDATRRASGQIPLLMLFVCAALGVLTASDLRVFLFMSAVSTVTMNLLISQGANPSRRNLSEQFLLSQFAGGALVTLGFSMLVVSIPWMKLPDSTTVPDLSWQIFSIRADLQKWTARSELAFHYESEVFPWIVLVLLLGFGIQSGLFPFHSLSLRIVSESQPVIAVIYLTGSLSAFRMAWFRFVMPLAPELLASFDTWMLIPSFVGAIWGALFALTPIPPRQRVAWIFTSLSSIAFVGCYTFTRMGMNGAWLMQQQLTVFTCASLLGIDSSAATASGNPQMESRQLGSHFRSRTLLVLIVLPILGLFASGYLIVSSLILETLFLTGIVFLVGTSLVVAMISLLVQHFVLEQFEEEQRAGKQREHFHLFRSGPIPGTWLVVTALAFVTSVFPGVLVHQCNSEFVRLFRRFEQSTTANSAENPSHGPQDGP